MILQEVKLTGFVLVWNSWVIPQLHSVIHLTLTRPDLIVKCSMYVKTTQRDGLLSYIGSEMIPDRPVPDYLSLELRNGKPVFKFNLGSGAGEIVHPWDIADGNWYKLTAERIGKTGYLKVNRDEKLGEPELTREGNSSGTFTVLELNPVTTKFYVGGVPDVILVPYGVQRANFEGFIEDIAFDESPMGLWNFLYGENNYMGAIERSELRTRSTTGFRFNGKGYVILDASEINFKPNIKGSIILQFKTYARNGLLMYMGKGRDFTSLELRDGRVLFQYDLGGMPAKLMSNRTYNDGEWHKIQAERFKQNGSLLIDRGDSVRGASPGTLSELAYTNDIFIGGYNKEELPVSKYVESTGFDGCIENVQFDTNKIDLNRNKVALGVIRGCPDQTLRTATFRQGQISYVAFPSDSVGVNFDVTFRMKTLSNDSMLLYTTNDDQTTAFSVSVVDGRVIVTSNPGNDLTRLESTVNTYNDGRWHYISIMKMGNKLMMNIDDQEMVNKTARTFADNVVTERPLYFGATDFTVAENLVGSTQPFFGCMSDVTINGRFLNFAEIPENYVNSVSFTECPLEDPEIDITIVPTLPPIVTEPTDETIVETTTPEVRPCALPLNTDLTGEGGTVDGTRFGIQRDSRQELSTLVSRLRVRSKMSVDIRTVASTGLIFYTADANHVDSFSIFMRKGKVVFQFNCGTGLAVITSIKEYNDGNWHNIEVYRNQKRGTLTIDGELVGEGESAGSTRSLNVYPPHYLGGLPDDVAEKAKKNLKDASGSFIGCIKNFKSMDKSIPEASITNVGSIQQCNSRLESGTFFHTDGGYVQLYENFNVGLDLSFSLSIRPRNLTGVILAVHAGTNSGDFMLLEMVNGQIVFKADNGKGIFTARYIPPLENTMCDGNWHYIEASKVKNVLLLKVDGSELNRGVGEAGTSETNTNDELFLGGVPDLNRRGVEANGNFIGCIRNFELDDVPQYPGSGTIFGSVKTDSCPVM
ncbi:hypothetical protein KUTeg_016648 [Tegillarca granosa]|uniref:Laminin G domain-containing protein n=1 Tax=Tegillarca granosa TaxID=220873 RepID=A0ABQ9ES48_TEGGR|nr:hypothetical protein KUTeg_016648 [Tegillarca granosa]